MGFRLGINTNFAINRIVEPEELVATVAEEVGLRYIQLTPEILSPDWPASTIGRHVKAYNRACERHRVRISHTFTGAYTRLNHLAHPDAEVRAHWVEWFMRWVDMAVDLGAHGTGSQIGILTYRDDRDPQRRRDRLEQARDCWRKIAEHAKSRGLEYLMWEPMSVRRELGHTIEVCRRQHRWLNEDMPLPIHLNSDIDHGDVSSPDPDDTDPYAWAEAFAADSPVIHIKQSSMNKGGHWPFTAKHNENGRIQPQRLLDAIRRGGGGDNELVFEFSFREREPDDSIAVDALRESVEFWRPYIED
ncbi:MAG: TIM barrel protein [Geminicoccaceae bacterium]|nr:TIM barrel protein [Geminicoccaceae bacterium]